MVARILRGVPGSLNGHVHTGEEHCGLRWLERSRVHHADSELTPSNPDICTNFCSTSTQYYTHLRPNYSTRNTVVVSVVCCPAWAESLVSSHLMRERSYLSLPAPVFFGLVRVVYGCPH
jgi:hypothetical protein